MPPPFGGGGGEIFGLAFVSSKICLNPKIMSIALTVLQLLKYLKRLKRGHASPPPLGGILKFFGSAFKSNVQNGPKSQKSCLYFKWYGSY